MCGVLLLISSKFNDVRQLRIKQLNRVLGSYLLDEYRALEGEVLEALGFQVVQERNIFVRLAKLHEKRTEKAEEMAKATIRQWPAAQDHSGHEQQAGAAISSEILQNE